MVRKVSVFILKVVGKIFSLILEGIFFLITEAVGNSKKAHDKYGHLSSDELSKKRDDIIQKKKQNPSYRITEDDKDIMMMAKFKENKSGKQLKS